MAKHGEPDEREVTTEFSAGISKWMPVDLSLSRKITQKWTARSQEFSDDVSAMSGLDDDGIGARFEQVEEMGDAYFDAGEKAVKTPDREFRSSLARLVAAGLKDDALVDESVYLTSVLKQLEPIHLRVLAIAAQAPCVNTENEVIGFGMYVTVKYLSLHSGSDPAIVSSAVMRLESLGLFTQRDDKGEVLRWNKAPGGYWWVTDLGRKLLTYCSTID